MVQQDASKIPSETSAAMDKNSEGQKTQSGGQSGGFAQRVRPGYVSPSSTENNAASSDVTPEDSANELLTKLQEKETEILDLKDKLLRAMAETENVRTRSRAQVEDAGKYAVSKFAEDMIHVLENLHRACQSITEEAKNKDPLLKQLFDGVEMTRRELENVFGKYAIQRIFPEGKLFDHHMHQAIAHVPDERYPSGTVIQVVQAGYTLHGRLLKPAMVVVSKPAGNTPSTSASDENTEQGVADGEDI